MEADEKFWKAFRKGGNRWEELLVVFWKVYSWNNAVVASMFVLKREIRCKTNLEW